MDDWRVTLQFSCTVIPKRSEGPVTDSVDLLGNMRVETSIVRSLALLGMTDCAYVSFVRFLWTQ